MNGDLQRFIFRHLGDKAKKMKEDFCLIDKNLRSKIIGQRGDDVLEREELLQNYKWCTTEVEFSRNILVWHLATKICYCGDKVGSNVFSEYEASRCLSEYMMYLLVSIRIRSTIQEAIRRRGRRMLLMEFCVPNYLLMI
jgi:hypothetical protein